jgi:hypothetical protein
MCALSLTWREEDGGSNELNGFVTESFTRPDGTQLGTQGSFFIQMLIPDHKAAYIQPKASVPWLQSCKHLLLAIAPISPFVLKMHPGSKR